ncbi:MAG: Hsp20/alpha crystallin family protein [Verrucomicrobia bacterium]|nr:Hsp20/alpha crystallin family protein [Verrucomicrobiota bacterium]
MEDIHSIYLKQLQGRLSGIVYELTKVRFSSFRPYENWCPAINAYRCRDSVIICVDLAGVDKSQIDVRVESRRVLIRGRRQPLEPDETEGRPMQILALEIDHGPFEREVALAEEVESNEVQAEQRNGLLWIYLPLRPPG